MSGRERTSLAVPVGRDHDAIELPVLRLQGRGTGPRVAILGGVHGDEYEGIAAAAAIWRAIEPDRLRGSLIIVPTCNLPAVEAGTRSSPVDERNLARTFPGTPDGTLTERIADALSREIIRDCDFLIDLHSAGQHYAMPLLAGCYAGADDLGRRCEAAALAFGAPLYWAHPDLAPGRSLSVALDAGIPNLYVECGGGGRVRAEHFDAYVTGAQRVLSHLGCLPARAAPAPPPTLRLRSTGDLDTWLTISAPGILLERVGLLDRVHEHDVLGTVVDARDGAILQELRAPFDGIVVMARRTARVRPGDGAYMLALPA